MMIIKVNRKRESVTSFEFEKCYLKKGSILT